MNNRILEAENLKKYYGKGHTLVKAVDDVSLELKRGEIVLIIGPSGSGKTTLISLIGGLLKPNSGSITIEGVNISKLKEKELTSIRHSKIGFIFQSFNLFSSLTVIENVMIPLLIKGINRKDAELEAERLIKRLKLERRKHNLPKNLSGGEKQRVAIARALINNPLLILADEPTANLDSENGEKVMEILNELAYEQSRSIVIVSHDQRIKDASDRIIKIENGKVI